MQVSFEPRRILSIKLLVLEMTLIFKRIVSELRDIKGLFVCHDDKTRLLHIFDRLQFFSLQVSFVVIISQTHFVLQMGVGFIQLLRHARSKNNIESAMHHDVIFSKQG